MSNNYRIKIYVLMYTPALGGKVALRAAEMPRAHALGNKKWPSACNLIIIIILNFILYRKSVIIIYNNYYIIINNNYYYYIPLRGGLRHAVLKLQFHALITNNYTYKN